MSNGGSNLKEIPKDLKDISPEDIDFISNQRGKLFNEVKIKTNQIRNFYSKVISIRNEFKNKKKLDDKLKKDLIMLKPAIAYAAGRQSSVRKFKDFIFKCVDAVINSNDKNKAMENFLSLIEGVVAYHKFYGDK